MVSIGIMYQSITMYLPVAIRLDTFSKIAQVDDLKHIDESVASSAEVTLWITSDCVLSCFIHFRPVLYLLLPLFWADVVEITTNWRPSHT